MGNAKEVGSSDLTRENTLHYSVILLYVLVLNSVEINFVF